MARELVLLPKVKYDKLMHDGDGQSITEKGEYTKPVKNKESGIRPNDDQISNDLENNRNHNMEPIQISNEKKRESNGNNHSEKMPLPRRSIRKKKSQRGGKLFIKETPTAFQKNVAMKGIKGKWLSFKI